MRPMEVRRLTVEDAEAYRTLRLEALRTVPTAFGSSYEDDARLPLSEFAKRVEVSESSAIYGAFEGGALVGSVGLYQEGGTKERHKAVLVGMYVAPAARRRGAARRLVKAVLEFAGRIDHVRQVKLAVEATNVPARALYESFGFEEFGRERRALFVAGQFYDEVHMVLFLDRPQGADSGGARSG